MAMMPVGWFIPLVGVIEILGGILFIIPRFRTLGALMILPVFIGILLTQITAAPSGLPLALVLGAILLWVIIESRQKFIPIVRNMYM